jgi:cell division protein FtsI (penicillin-binding protein 3)
LANRQLLIANNLKHFMNVKKQIVLRLILIYVAVLIFAVIIIARIFYLQVFEYDKWKSKESKAELRDVNANRGDIYDVEGRLLVSSIPQYDVFMDLKSKSLKKDVFNKGVDSLAMCLAKMFKDSTKSEKELRAEYLHNLKRARRERDGYFLIRKNVSWAQCQQMKKFPIFRKGQFKGGFIAIQSMVRKKPFKTLASRTIGRIMNKGETQTVVGIEGAYDKYLRGVTGKRMMQISNKLELPVSDENDIEPTDGDDVVTTLDINLQDVAQTALQRQLVANKAHHGCVIVMEVETGEIRAIANLVDTLGEYQEAYNYAVGESTEPGSTFKLASMIAAFEDGFISLNDTVETKGGLFDYYGFKIRDSHEGGYGRISVKQAFELSSNTGIAKIITKYYEKKPEKFIDHLYDMKLNKPLGIEIKGEGAPYIKYPGDRLWSKISLPQMAIGYELQVTPLQTLTLYNAVANNGKMVKPKFIRAIRSHGEIIKSFETEVIKESICSKNTIKNVKKMLEGVVEHGTASNLNGQHFKIAGKTGTAQVHKKEGGYQENKTYQASFVGYFPAEKPKYSCIVVIFNPSNAVYYGNIVAGPVFREIADKIYATNLDLQYPLQYSMPKGFADIPSAKHGYKQDFVTILKNLKIPARTSAARTEYVFTTGNGNLIECQNRSVQKNLVPNVEGMGARDAVSLLESAGLKVTIRGRGRVVNQSVVPGSKIKKGTLVSLEMSQI